MRRRSSKTVKYWEALQGSTGALLLGDDVQSAATFMCKCTRQFKLSNIIGPFPLRVPDGSEHAQMHDQNISRCTRLYLCCTI